MFIVKCQKNQARVLQTEPITSGSSNVYVVRFELSEEWDPLTTTAVFMAENRIVNVLLDEDRECMVPWEVMQYAGAQVMVGVFGTMNGDVILPTIWASMGNLQQGVTTGVYPSNPTPSIYQQIVDEIKRVKDQMEHGIPYAIDGIVNNTVTNTNDLSHLNLPCNVILLNSSFSNYMNVEESITYANEIVYVELIGEDTLTPTVRVTDWEGNVYDFPTDEDGNFTSMIFVRDGTIKTPYQLALENGFQGTEKEWLESLKGPLPIYYKGESLTIDAPLDEIMITNRTISKDLVSRYPDIGEYLIIPVNGENDEAYLITYRVDSYDNDGNLTCIPSSILNVSGKIGPVGPIGPVHLWVDTSSTLESINPGDSINVPNTAFNREPVEGENVNGTIVSDGVKPPYLYFLSGTIESIDDAISTIKVNIASNLHVTIDGFVPDFITKDDVDNLVAGKEVEDKENGVVGIEALKAVLANDLDILVVDIPSNEESWGDGSSGKEWVWNFPENVHPRLIMIPGVDSWEWFGSYGVYEDRVSLFANSIPEQSYKMVVIYGKTYVGNAVMFIDHGSAVVPVNKGGTGETSLAAAYSKLVEASTDLLPVNKGGTGAADLPTMLHDLIDALTVPSNVTLAEAYLPFVDDNNGGSNRLKISSIINWATGRTSSLTSSGTDYSTYRARAIGFDTSVPSGISNGYIYGIYA